MGEIFFHTGLGARMFNAIDKLLGKLPGRLSYVTVLGGTAFSTLSGSSMGSTALLGWLMVPEMTNARLQEAHVDRSDPRAPAVWRSSFRPRRLRFCWRRWRGSTWARC